MLQERAPYRRLRLQRERKAETQTSCRGVKLLSLAVAEVKQSRRNQSNQRPPSSSSIVSKQPSKSYSKAMTERVGEKKSNERVHATAVTVSMDNSSEVQRRKPRVGGVRKGKRSRAKVNEHTRTKLRNLRRKNREKAQLASAVESLQRIQHDSAQLIVVQGL